MRISPATARRRPPQGIHTNASAIMPALEANGVWPMETRIVRGTKAWAAERSRTKGGREPPCSVTCEWGPSGEMG
ncbi:MAG: hypothetical protein WBD05_07800 [Phycisphaerae bacterium]